MHDKSVYCDFATKDCDFLRQNHKKTFLQPPEVRQHSFRTISHLRRRAWLRSWSSQIIFVFTPAEANLRRIAWLMAHLLLCLSCMCRVKSISTEMTQFCDDETLLFSILGLSWISRQPSTISNYWQYILHRLCNIGHIT